MLGKKKPFLSRGACDFRVSEREKPRQKKLFTKIIFLFVADALRSAANSLLPSSSRQQPWCVSLPLVACSTSAHESHLVARANWSTCLAVAPSHGDREKERRRFRVLFSFIGRIFNSLFPPSLSHLLRLLSPRSAASPSRRSARPCWASSTTAPTSSCSR